MSATNLKALYNIAPGFRDDKDDRWIQHLVLADKTQMRRLRANFIMLLEKLEGLKSERKEYNSTAPKYRELSVQINDQTKILDRTIQGLIITLTNLRDKAFKARDAEERRQASSNMAQPFSGFSAFDPVLGDTFLPGALAGFLPQSYPQPKPEPKPAPQTHHATQPELMEVSSQSSIEELPIDYYMIGVDEKFVSAMEKLRKVNEKFACKDRALDALIRLDQNDRNLAILETIKNWEKTKQKAPGARAVAMTEPQ